MKSTTVNDLVNYFGTQSELARVCGISPQAVFKWRSIPPQHCIAIEEASDGAFIRYQLRPDVFGKDPGSAYA